MIRPQSPLVFVLYSSFSLMTTGNFGKLCAVACPHYLDVLFDKSARQSIAAHCCWLIICESGYTNEEPNWHPLGQRRRRRRASDLCLIWISLFFPQLMIVLKKHSDPAQTHTLWHRYTFPCFYTLLHCLTASAINLSTSVIGWSAFVVERERE